MNKPAAIATTDFPAFERIVRNRRSVRGFLPDPVPSAVLREIFELAQQAPSNCNVQPWHVVVASGAACRAISEKLLTAIASGQPVTSDYQRVEEFPGVMRQRQIDTAVRLYGNMGIARDDREGRRRAMLRNYEFFDAPHVAFIGMDRMFHETVAIDVGMYAQTLMLAMTAHGIGSCAQAAISRFPELIRAQFGIPENIGILMGISFGYEDTGVPANRTRIPRAPLGELVRFID
ncbi:MAG TPA: nitroreductase [Porticoccaceae bacterium]|nr:nitroreductase [Porticoccaceae bacterium]